jgi:hypothetical protein
MLEHSWIEKLAIQELCARYCHTIDSQDSEGWARCFTADGVFEFDGWAIRGRRALAEYAAVHARVMRCRHMTLNCLYEVRGEQATGRSTTVVTLATKGGYKILGQGAYEDQLVKDGGEWLIVHRRVKTAWWPIPASPSTWPTRTWRHWSGTCSRRRSGWARK